MRVINMSGGLRFWWEPCMDLVCFRCREPLDISTIRANTVECVNFVWPDEEAIRAGEYFYLHKRCSNVPGDWYMLDVKTIIGKDRFPSLVDAWKACRKLLPPGIWEKLRDEWIPTPDRRPSVVSSKTYAVIPGVVYLIEAEGSGCIKIGRGRSASYRLAALATASPFPLRLLREVSTTDAAGLERTLHQRYSAYRTHGEWFELPRDAVTELLKENFPI